MACFGFALSLVSRLAAWLLSRFQRSSKRTSRQPSTRFNADEQLLRRCEGQTEVEVDLRPLRTLRWVPLAAVHSSKRFYLRCLRRLEARLASSRSADTPHLLSSLPSTLFPLRASLLVDRHLHTLGCSTKMPSKSSAAASSFEWVVYTVSNPLPGCREVVVLDKKGAPIKCA